MKVLLYPHGGSGNHGCEALVRSTAKILGTDICLLSSCPEQDYQYELNTCCSIIKDMNPINKSSLSFYRSWIRYHLLNDKKAFDQLAFKDQIKLASKCDIALSIGGDNYCYGVPERLYYLDREFRNKTKLILWGASIDPAALDRRMLDDLSSFSRIIARESITYNMLRTSGLNNVSISPDPAFLLEKKDVIFPSGFNKENIVGINLSPMVISRESHNGIIFNNYCNLLEYLINDTEFSIALIPHVVWNSNDDRVPLKQLFDLFKDTGRILMVDDHSAEELKGFISQCRFMVASRTHASIAAYSSCIPTLVMGYSVKAIGIARDVMGTDDHYVLPVQSLSNNNALTDAFRWLQSNEDRIRSHLINYIPKYISRCIVLKDTVKSVMNS